ncbi:pyridoxamine 5'-phosphate oxidase family protein [Nostocaceae cyanobacterium CENA357]|uniref:Pyridoxamine 5'-phosphate oxidase family protein n=1 Tax=Atlanticothrix silvestris CENA357 TaxID=1725252 RepID=A0A8J7HNH9_9CYAN|nr:pyridoxamine 5'-phosphate oxidase family protein [Atlanticothrix silvestris]MBH8556158.1 pyridoxamine 5'-phosphate oxidase family protein [Atlanticothrix silvestris CENA357]
MTTSTDRNQQIQKLRELIADIDCGMLTTVEEDGSLHSCPMSKNGEITSEGTLWFFIYRSSHKVAEIEHNQQVNVSFSSADQQQYISLSGTAQLVQDRDTMQEKWESKLQTWFPKGLDEPDIALLKVNINKADYWDSRTSFKAQTINLSTLSSR